MANWLIFSKISKWADLLLPGFQYDGVSDADITSALANSSVITSIDTNLDWEDDEYLSGTPDVAEDKKHAHRIAALVHEFRVCGNMRNAVEIDTFRIDRCCSGVTNGHHRIRAMQFLGVECGPFSLSGSLDMLEDLVRVAGTECPAEFRRYFGPSLLAATGDYVPAAARPTRR